MADALPALVADLAARLRRRQVEGSIHSARRTAELLRQVISQHRMPAAGPAAPALLDAVRAVGRLLTAANPTGGRIAFAPRPAGLCPSLLTTDPSLPRGLLRSELAVGNIVRRVLHIIREEDVALLAEASASAAAPVSGQSSEPNGAIDLLSRQHGSAAQSAAASNINALRAPSLSNLLELPVERATRLRQEAGSAQDYASPVESEVKSKLGKGKHSWSWRLKHNVIEGVNELLDEINNYSSQVADQALEHIHQNEVILTVGRSPTLLKFFKEAKKKRLFQVVVAEGAPRYDGQILAKELAAVGVQTTSITDSAIFAMMARINMVIVAAHAVMADGGVIAPVGLHMTALAAQRHAVPFVVLAAVFKLCPLFPQNHPSQLNELKSPAAILSVGDYAACLAGAPGSPPAHVLNPAFDYIPPHLISLFITDTGGHNPSYMYRLVQEYYSPEDLTI
eukprot:SM000026S08879  [mRNA]  locus=s26:188853:191332:- [translate_table: standard]